MEYGVQLNAADVWTEIADRLRSAISDQTYHTWFGEVRTRSVDGGVVVLETPNGFSRSWIEGHYLELLSGAARDLLGSEARVRLIVRELPQETPELEDRRPRRVEGLSPKYSFDTFVIGSSNRFAHAAALAVAEAPAQAYNPLFVYGGTGLGKTHLLQAVAAYVSQHSARFSVRYVTSETLTNDFINSIREKRVEAFKQRYRGYDVLLVDDIQFLEHKERIQEEFFHTFNTLYEAGSQIVLSSDRPPRDIATLEERLRSRFEWGLIVDIQPPDLETRIAILRKKVATDRINVPDAQVLTFIAGRVSSNIRELEGRADPCGGFLVADRPGHVGRAGAGGAEGRLPTRRGARDLDRAHPGGRLGAVCDLVAGARRPAALTLCRVPAPRRDVPVPRADRQLAAEDRPSLRRTRPHDRHQRDLQHHKADSRRSRRLQPRPGTHSPHQAGDVKTWGEPRRRLLACREPCLVHTNAPRPDTAPGAGSAMSSP